ncbi:hypothetical protein DL766_010376 [Monosporascus sp. MC13-8B]|uniref:CENP-V/GFA domain-containing protein n=1 Tax=Monosporascus cannonballus TaxID=155416 RepID=A0ABY0GSR0_9PEZI|nr:hypothetical protein DL762_009672 [Monosporascus cannonballus]RYO81051.1 hypothetical protein DL763_008690 [Monosporascus cannonballus]RYP02400.1 hypothetical protein DL766_010376 [Monosporascus sp. MC13-8B]
MTSEQPSEARLKTYRGCCHCGAYIFDAKLPEASSINASECNCSICSRLGAVWKFPLRSEDIAFVKGDLATLTSYAFGNKMITYKFCPKCGVSLVGVGYLQPPKEGEEREPAIAVSLRAIQQGQGLDIWKMDLGFVDGASFPPVYESPVYTGPEPKAEVEGGKLYTGSCHCGAVRVAVKTKPLGKTYDAPIRECNCSICLRHGALWIYPNKEQVEIQGEENLGTYTFGTHAWGKTFCKTCGVPVHNQIQALTEEQLGKFSEDVRNFILGAAHLKPVNIRILNGINTKELNVSRIDGYSMPPVFVEPQP